MQSDYATDEVRERLMAEAGNWRDIARKTGIDYGWISRFARGRVDGPSARVVELAEYLQERETTDAPAE